MFLSGSNRELQRILYSNFKYESSKQRAQPDIGTETQRIDLYLWMVSDRANRQLPVNYD